MKYIFICLIFLISSGCITSFDLELDANEFLLVVDGKITQKNASHELFLMRSNRNGLLLSNPVTKAKVTLFDENGNSEQYIENGEGKYVFYGESMPRNPGISYFIEIELQNNKKYRSRAQVMPDVVKPEKAYYELAKIEEVDDPENVIFKRYLNIFVDTPVQNNNQKYYFTWRIDHAYSFTEIQCPPPPNQPPKTPVKCFISRKFINDDIKIFSSENLSGGVLEGFRVASVYLYPDWEFYEKHFYNIAQHSITYEAYTYWETVKKVAQSTGSIFDTPPAPINGNIYNVNDPDERVLGFFEVSAVDTIRTYTFNEDLEPISIRNPCPFERYLPRHWACCNCLTIPDSHLERPGYWSYLHDE